jgi:hypothetical protein
MGWIRDGFEAVAAWVLVGLLITSPLWLGLGGEWLAIGAMGPLGLMAYKPGQLTVEKLTLVGILSLPTVIGLAVLMWKWTSLNRLVRPLAVAGLSLVWHGVSLVLWMMIAGGLN